MFDDATVARAAELGFTRGGYCGDAVFYRNEDDLLFGTGKFERVHHHQAVGWTARAVGFISPVMPTFEAAVAYAELYDWGRH